MVKEKKVLLELRDLSRASLRRKRSRITVNITKTSLKNSLSQGTSVQQCSYCPYSTRVKEIENWSSKNKLRNPKISYLTQINM